MQIPILLESSDENEGGKEWVMLELQGDLESRKSEINFEGKFIGDLHFTKPGMDGKSNPILIIGHHILHGKVIHLEKPIIIIKKHKREEAATAAATAATDEEFETRYHIKGILKKKLLFKTRPKPIIANVPKKL